MVSRIYSAMPSLICLPKSKGTNGGLFQWTRAFLNPTTIPADAGALLRIRSLGGQMVDQAWLPGFASGTE